MIWIPSNSEAVAPTITNYGRLPTRIDAGAHIHFWLTYTSDENNPPTYVRVTRAVPTSVVKTMAQNDTGDTDYTDGATFYYDWWFYDYIYGVTIFTLRIKDAVYPEVIKSVTVASIPFPYLQNECAIQNPNGTFSFSATYVSVYNYAAQKVEVAIDGVFHAMTKNDSSSTDWINGVAYRYNTTNPLLEGNHSYQFFCQDNCAVPSSNNTSGVHLLMVLNRLGVDSVQISMSAIAMIGIISAVITASVMIAMRRR